MWKVNTVGLGFSASVYSVICTCFFIYFYYPILAEFLIVIFNFTKYNCKLNLNCYFVTNQIRSLTCEPRNMLLYFENYVTNVQKCYNISLLENRPRKLHF